MSSSLIVCWRWECEKAFRVDVSCLYIAATSRRVVPSSGGIWTKTLPLSAHSIKRKRRRRKTRKRRNGSGVRKLQLGKRTDRKQVSVHIFRWLKIILQWCIGGYDSIEKRNRSYPVQDRWICLICRADEEAHQGN